MEHWEEADLDEWADGRRTIPLPDGVVLGHQEYRAADVLRLVTENPALRFCDYFTVWTYPPSDWVNKGNSFFDAMAEIQGSGIAWFDTKTSYPGISIYKGRMLARLDDVRKPSAPAHVAEVILSARGPEWAALERGRGNIYLDQFYPDGLDDWMAQTYEGSFSVERLDPAQEDRHVRAMRRLIDELAGPRQILTGGSLWHVEPSFGKASRYYEGTGTFPTAADWDKVLAGWKSNSGNVLSVLAESPENVDRAINEWLDWGGWLAFTTQLEGDAAKAATDAAYSLAWSSRDAVR